jgi:predicted metal-dependent phosphoesterase TrpH
VIYKSSTDRYEKIWQLVAEVIAHPHRTTTPHDKHRATVLINFLSGDNDLVEYIYSQMNEEDFKQTKQIRTFIYDKEITN